MKTTATKPTAPKFRPVGDRILVELIDLKDDIRGGIIIPDAAKEVPQIGTVLGVGAKVGLDVDKPEIAVGDKVMTNKFGGTEVKIDGRKYVIVHEKDILGVLA